MGKADSTHRWYQYSLWSLLVFSAFVAFLCSVGASTTWEVPIAILGGIGVSFLGYHPLSLRKHPSAGDAFATMGFLVRLSGLLLVSYGLLRFVAKVVWHREHIWP